MNERIKIRIGDYYDDGHGKHREFIFAINKNPEDVVKAYKYQGELIGVIDKFGRFNFCNEYESSKVDEDTFNTLASSLDLTEIFGGVEFFPTYIDNNSLWYLEQEDLPILFFLLAKLDIPDLEYEQIDAYSIIDIGGYGLF